MRIYAPVLILLLSSALTSTLADPPKVVSTSPGLWATNVNAATQKNVSVTFDQALRAEVWDWFGRGVLSPDSNARPSFNSDRRIASLGVRLDPGKVYILALNEKGISSVGFQSEKGVSLPPTYFVFQTAGPSLPDDVPPRVLRSVPNNGAPSVDSTRTSRITITFDKPMNPNKHGLHLYENNQLVDIAKSQCSFSGDGMTFAIVYRLKPATLYRVELNSTKDIGFARTTRVPLWPTVISFSTR
jgi:hypothetical protein